MTDHSESTPVEPTNPDAPGATSEPADATSDISDRLTALETAATDLRDHLAQAERTHAIDRELLLAGVVDIDTARSLAAQRIDAGATPTEAVAQLRQRRPVLFAQRSPGLRATTVGAAEPGRSRDLAAEARRTGNRQVLLDYLRDRRASA